MNRVKVPCACQNNFVIHWVKVRGNIVGLFSCFPLKDNWWALKELSPWVDGYATIVIYIFCNKSNLE